MESDLYREFFNTSMEACFVLNRQTQSFIAVNDSFLQVTGYSRDDFLSGRITIAELVDPEFLPFARLKAREREQVSQERYSIRIRTGLGRALDIEVSVRAGSLQGNPCVFGVIRPEDLSWFVPSGTLEAGMKLGRYEVLSEVGRGAFGIVYRSRDHGLGRVVALKVLIPGAAAEPDAVERFRREATILARLGRHPNVVQVFDAGNQGAVHYIAMDYVNGPSLARLLAPPSGCTAGDAERTLVRDHDSRSELLKNPAFATRFVAKTARALEHAHLHGVVHRDIKPGNILVDERNEPQVTDFGLAKILTPEFGSSLSVGKLVGTPAYMSPEQIAGTPETVDRRTDIYSLGTTLYQLLTGVPPYRAESLPDLLLKVVMGSVARPSSFRGDVPSAMEAACMRAMDRDSAERYPTAAEFASALEATL